MASTSEYDSDTTKTFANDASDVDAISDFDDGSSSEQEENQGNQSDCDEEEDETDGSAGACGTIRQDRLTLPEFKAKIGKGQQIYKNTDNVLALKWQGKKEVRMLLTINESQMNYFERNNTKVQKSVSVIDYNSNIHATDTSDMQISLVACLRKSKK
ncbi:unnamed protein product [Rotaria sp. Silwood2]|nr:unnamed protein product [Rotaria sp. Silwood2]CAF4248398.1 unnamed protein product [Rotaria sp. Silwood2]